MEKVALTIVVPGECLGAVQGAIETYSKRILRHDQQPCKGRVMTDFDITYAAKQMADLSILREALASAMESAATPPAAMEEMGQTESGAVPEEKWTITDADLAYVQQLNDRVINRGYRTDGKLFDLVVIVQQIHAAERKGEKPRMIKVNENRIIKEHDLVVIGTLANRLASSGHTGVAGILDGARETLEQLAKAEREV